MMWPFSAGVGTAAIGTGRPAPADFACFLLERCGGSHSLRPEARRDESVTAFAEYRVESMIGEPMKELSDKLVRVVRSAESILLQVPEAESGRPVLSGGWSRKQVLGHLIDSASNNHQRFVRAALQTALDFPGYDQRSEEHTSE